MTNPDPGQPDGVPKQSFGPTTGVFSGWIGLAGVVVIAFFVARDLDLRNAVRWLGLLLSIGVLVWAYLLRPRVIVAAGRVVLRNAFLDVTLPWSLIEECRVRAVTQVWASGKKYVGVAVGRNLRQSARSRTTVEADPTFDVVENMINDRAGQPGDGSVERRVAVPELVAFLVGLVAFAGSFLGA